MCGRMVARGTAAARAIGRARARARACPAPLRTRKARDDVQRQQTARWLLASDFRCAAQSRFSKPPPPPPLIETRSSVASRMLNAVSPRPHA